MAAIRMIHVPELKYHCVRNDTQFIRKPLTQFVLVKKARNT